MQSDSITFSFDLQYSNRKNFKMLLLLFIALLLGNYSVSLEPQMDEFPEEYSLRGSSWCQSKSFNQTVSKPKCKSRSIPNKMCLGECLSYYLPTRDHDEVVSFACRPEKEEMRAVFLQCPDHPSSKVQIAFVQIIRKCSCMLIDMKKPQSDAKATFI